RRPATRRSDGAAPRQARRAVATAERIAIRQSPAHPPPSGSRRRYRAPANASCSRSFSLGFQLYSAGGVEDRRARSLQRRPRQASFGNMQHGLGEIDPAGGAKTDVGRSQSRIDFDDDVVGAIRRGAERQIDAQVAKGAGQRAGGPLRKRTRSDRQFGGQRQRSAEVGEAAIVAQALAARRQGQPQTARAAENRDARRQARTESLQPAWPPERIEPRFVRRLQIDDALRAGAVSRLPNRRVRDVRGPRLSGVKQSARRRRDAARGQELGGRMLIAGQFDKRRRWSEQP